MQYQGVEGVDLKRNVPSATDSEKSYLILPVLKEMSQIVKRKNSDE